jgi:hypothetical protein
MLRAVKILKNAEDFSLSIVCVRYFSCAPTFPGYVAGLIKNFVTAARYETLDKAKSLQPCTLPALTHSPSYALASFS